jgi:hypothetical protein
VKCLLLASVSKLFEARILFDNDIHFTKKEHFFQFQAFGISPSDTTLQFTVTIIAFKCHTCFLCRSKTVFRVYERDYMETFIGIFDVCSKALGIGPEEE